MLTEMNSEDKRRCKDFLQDLSLYLDKEATAQLCEQIEQHIAGCADCRVVVDTLSRTIALYRALPQPEMPESLRTQLYRTLDLGEYLDLHQTPEQPEG